MIHARGLVFLYLDMVIHLFPLFEGGGHLGFYQLLLGGKVFLLLSPKG